MANFLLIQAEAAGLFHDTAGWRNLETSLSALKEMAVGCGRAFQADDDLLPVLVTAVKHDNRYRTGLNGLVVKHTC